ncbi:LOW QUALITY PROTEIN: Gag-Pol polyprotein [Frankliniella fusca]|uniref:Gag-Pol polyprotein n=1 Tax=Frankliniella fusca TaxID=407009 RepID=A0AAE1I4D1_9NEOP|nr:LOW QUALITY PROTEIN: Gag-Pol polyprotein [Frankliniella fusca]
MHPVPIPARAMAQVGVDIAQLPEMDGFKYICVAICYFTKYSEARALPDKSAAGIARFLYEDVICRHGCPETFISDQGREFCNDLMTELFRLTGARQRVTSPYHPQANGLVERKNRTIKNTFLKVLLAKEMQWPQILPGVLFAHRAAKHASTGRNPRMPAELPKERADDTSEGEEDVDDPAEGNDKEDIEEEEEEKEDIDDTVFENVIEQMAQVEDAITEAAMRNIKKAQARHAKKLRTTSDTLKLFVGQSVFLENMKRKDRKGGKLVEGPRDGPYKVVEIHENKLVTLQNQLGCILKTKYNIKQCVPYSIAVLGKKRKSAHTKDEYGSMEVDNEHAVEKQDKNGHEKSDRSKDSYRPANEISSEKAEANDPDQSARSEDSDILIQSPANEKSPGKDKADHDQSSRSENDREHAKCPENPSSGTYLESEVCLHTPFNTSSICVSGGRVFNPPTRDWKLATCKHLKINVKDESIVSDSIKDPKPLTKSKELQPIIGDGNCYFRSLSMILTGSENYHAAIRRKLVAYMQKEPSVAKYTGKASSAMYVKESAMANLKVFATEIEIIATAMWLKIDVYTESVNNERQLFTASGKLADGPSTENAIYIKNTNRNHYDVVLDVMYTVRNFVVN